MSLRGSRYIKQLQPVTLPLSTLKGVGPKRAVHFARKGIHTILDLFFFTPLRYEDRTCVRPVSACEEGGLSLVQGHFRRGRKVLSQQDPGFQDPAEG